MNKYKKFEESRKHFMNFTEGKRYGLCLWEIFQDNFKLECWNIIEEGEPVQPHIFQIWADGNGFTEYKPTK